MDIELNDIALFIEVAKRKSFSQTAEALGIPAATISRRVTSLENTVGAALLTRSTRRISLTEAGRMYFERCRPIIEEASVAHTHLLDMAAQPKGRLQISLPASLAQLILPLVIKDFRAQYPDIELDFDMSLEPIDPITHSFDLALRFGKQPDSTLIARQIVLMDHNLYASPEYLSQHGTPRKPTDLTYHECLRPAIHDSFSCWVLHSGDKTESVNVSGRLAANNIGMMHRFASQGLGIAPLLFLDALDPSTHNKELVRVLPEWSLARIPLFALLPSRTMPAKTRAFLDFIQPRLTDPKAWGTESTAPLDDKT